MSNSESESGSEVDVLMEESSYSSKCAANKSISDPKSDYHYY